MHLQRENDGNMVKLKLYNKCIDIFLIDANVAIFDIS